MKRNDRPDKDDLWLESETPQIFFARLGRATAESFLKMIYRIARKLYRPQASNIMLVSETKANLSGNLLSLQQRLMARASELKLNVSYSCAPVLAMSSISAFWYWIRLVIKLARQDFVFVDDYTPLFKFLDLADTTKLIQVWHAGVGFKSVGYARFGKTHSPRALNSAYRKYDFVIVGSTALIPVYEEVFGLPSDKFLPTGLPKVDDFINGQEETTFSDEFYRKYPHAQGKSMVLFAPTYRGDGQQDAHYPWGVMDWQVIYDLCGEGLVWAIKSHPFITEPASIPQYLRDRIIDVSHEDINNLLHLADILVTDYSSVIYEYSLLRRPMVFFAFDLDQYQSRRGFHGDYPKMVPGTVCDTFEQLVEAIREGQHDLTRIDRYIKYAFDYTDAGACDRIIDQLIVPTQRGSRPA